MNILVIGSGGREHAICKALKQSPKLKTLYCSPGNAGIALDAVCVPLKDHAAIAEFCKARKIDLVVIGPEQPLVEGMADDLRKAGIATFGPSAKAAQLEGSKGFTKDLCRRYQIPTADYQRFTDLDDAIVYVERKGAPIVIKADGLAAGKGVTVAMTEDEAYEALEDIFGGKFGAAGASVVIEEYMEGEELSFFALCDGKTAIPFCGAQDHKRVGDGDTGPNTGGMGTYSPAPMLTPELEKRIMDSIILPTVSGMAKEGMPFQGVLFAGLMLTKDGPKLIEYNARFGDPETQVMLARITSDLADVLDAAAKGELSRIRLSFSPKAALCVVMATKGYPEAAPKGSIIRGIDKAEKLSDVVVYHAGTAPSPSGEQNIFTASGGRVLGVTALGATIAEAQKRAYEAVDLIDWKEGFCRRDIGARAVKAGSKVA